MVDPVIFIGTIIIAITEAIKYLAPNVRGILTVIVALIVGMVVALVDTGIGLPDISVATGILTGLSAVGVASLASKVSTHTETRVR